MATKQKITTPTKFDKPFYILITHRRFFMKQQHLTLKNRFQLKKKTIGIATVLLALIVIPEFAWAQFQTMSFPLIDTMLCGAIFYFKSKLAPYVAVICVICGWLGHWIGTGKVWGTMLNIALGLGVISGVGAWIATSTSFGASCLMY